jgi:hypothetical protein
MYRSMCKAIRSPRRRTRARGTKLGRRRVEPGVEVRGQGTATVICAYL